MSRGEAQLLFNRHRGYDVQQHILAQIGPNVDALSEEQLLNSELQSLIQYYVDKYHVEVPTILWDHLTADPREESIRKWDRYRDSEVVIPGATYTFEVPFEGEEDVFAMQPNTHNFNPPSGEIVGHTIVFRLSDREVTEDAIKRCVDDMRKGLDQYLGWHRELWNNFDAQIADVARARIVQRRDRLNKQKQVGANLSALGIRLKEKPGDTRTYAAPAIRQKITPHLPPVKPRQPPEPTLDATQYDIILQLIRDSARSVERSSSRTRQLDEETLRDMLLVPLNAHFEGGATGEAFNYNGKTDILIRHEGGNLFVAECKIWSGEKQLLDAIDQILSYLTWRDTKALIVFSRNAGFTAVANKLAEAPKAHPCYVDGPTKSDETTFRFKFHLPADTERHVTLTVLGFDLGSPNGSGPRIRQL